MAQRWRCTTCGYVFRVYPTGVSRRQQSQRLQACSVGLWVLGLSLGAVSDILAGLACPLGRTTVYANLQQAGTVARRRLRERLKGHVQVRVVAVDGTHVKRQGHDTVLLQALDAQTGLTLEIIVVPGEDERTIRRYVERLARLTGCQVLVSDDADAYKAAADAVGLDHQICQQHVVPNTLTLLTAIAAQLEALPVDSQGPGGLSAADALVDVALLEDLILARAPGSGPPLAELQRRYQAAPQPRKGTHSSPWWRLRLLTLDLAEDWTRLTLTERYRDPPGQRLVPATNNLSEREIGRTIKERYRTMRGYKSTASLRRLPALTAYLRERQGTECLSELLPA